MLNIMIIHLRAYVCIFLVVLLILIHHYTNHCILSFDLLPSFISIFIMR